MIKQKEKHKYQMTSREDRAEKKGNHWKDIVN